MPDSVGVIPPNEGFMIIVDRRVIGDGNRTFGYNGWPQSNKQGGVELVTRRGVHFVRVYLGTGSGTLQFKRLTLSVRNPKVNMGLSPGLVTGPGIRATGFIPLVNASTSSPILSGDNTPTLATGGPVAPQFLGQMYIDTAARRFYTATALSSPPVVGDWTIN